MTIHPVYPQQAAPAPGQEAGASTAYDTLWTETGVPEHEPSAFERVMLAQDKLYVVLAVVLILWIGIAFFILRTDRKLSRLERAVASRLPDASADTL